MDAAMIHYLQKKAYMMAMALLIIGGLNWLLVGLFNVNIVQAILGKNVLSRGIFTKNSLYNIHIK